MGAVRGEQRDLPLELREKISARVQGLGSGCYCVTAALKGITIDAVRRTDPGSRTHILQKYAFALIKVIDL